MTLLLSFILAGSLNVNSIQMCQFFGDMFKTITQDRDNGTPLSQELHDAKLFLESSGVFTKANWKGMKTGIMEIYIHPEISPDQVRILETKRCLILMNQR